MRSTMQISLYFEFLLPVNLHYISVLHGNVLNRNLGRAPKFLGILSVPWAPVNIAFLGRILFYTSSHISLRVFNFGKYCCKESSLVNIGSFSNIQNLDLSENKSFAEYLVLSKSKIQFSLSGLSMTTSLKMLFIIVILLLSLGI